MASKHICPKCGNRTFSTPAHVMQDWKVNEDGEFIECLQDCMQVSFPPRDENIWTCTECDGEGVIIPDNLVPEIDSLSAAFAALKTETLDDVVKSLNLSPATIDFIHKTRNERN